MKNVEIMQYTYIEKPFRTPSLNLALVHFIVHAITVQFKIFVKIC